METNNLRGIMLIIYASTFFATTVISSCIPLFSDEADLRSVPNSLIGITLAANPFAQIISIYYLGENMETNKKAYQKTGIVMLALGSFSFGLVYLIQARPLFVIASVFARYALLYASRTPPPARRTGSCTQKGQPRAN